MSKKTLWRWLERLEKARRIASVSDMKQTPILDSAGVPHETTLYNLNVLNQLAMVCIDNENLNDISCKFSDMLSELEECGRIQSGQDFNQIKIADNNGRGHETTLYNLNVLNQLAMVEMKNKVLNETAKKFSDILSEVETTH